MSKSHCLPMGAPMKRYMDPDLLLVRTNQSESPGMKRKRPIGDDDDESEDEAMLLASAKNQPFSRILNIASTAVPRKRGKDAKPVDQLDIKTGELLRRYARQSDVCESMKVAQIYISECCRGMRSDCVGFKWRFADDAPPEEKDAKATDPWTPMAELLVIRNHETNKSNFGIKFTKKEDGTYVDPRKERRLSRLRGEDDPSDADLDDDEDDADRARPRSRKQPVEQIDLVTGKVVRRYLSQMKAASAMHLNQFHVSMACRGAKKEAGGFGWRSCDEEVDLDDPSYLPLSELLAMKAAHRRQADAIKDRVVEQRQLGTHAVVRRYANLASAVSLAGVSTRIVLRCLQGEREDAYGYAWACYDGPPLNLEEDNAQEGRPSLKEVAAEIRAFKKHMSELRKDSALLANMDDDDLGDIEELEEEEEEPRVAHRAAPTGTRIEQLDLGSGAVVHSFENVKHAALSVGGLETFISNCVHGVVDEAYGFGWRFAQVKEEAEAEEEATTSELLDFVEDLPTSRLEEVGASAGAEEGAQEPAQTEASEEGASEEEAFEDALEGPSEGPSEAAAEEVPPVVM